jgi:hypothetical protein
MIDNIVFLADYAFYKNKLTTVNNDFINSIKNNNEKYNITIFYTDDEPHDVLLNIIYLSPKAIIIFECNNFQRNTRKFDYIFNLKIPIAIFIDDTYYLTSYTSTCPHTAKVDSIIFWYKNDKITKSYQEVYKDKLITHIDSRYTNTEIYKDYGLEKKYDILLYGTRNFLHPYKKEQVQSIQDYISKYEAFYKITISRDDKINFYTLRNKIEQVLIKNSHKYNLLILPETSIMNPDIQKIANAELSKLINQSYLTVSCTTLADVMLHKYVEISASKSVILGDYPSDYKELYENNIVEVNVFMTEEEILEKIDDALANKNKLIEMSERMYHKIQNEHNLKQAQICFNSVIDKIISIDK